MSKSTMRKRNGSFDINESVVQSNFIVKIPQKMEPEQKIVNYNGDDGFEIIEKVPLNQPIQILTRDQLYKISQGYPYDRQNLAATLLQQRKIPFQTRKAIWMRFVERGQAQQFFSKEPSQKVKSEIEKDVARSGESLDMNSTKFRGLIFKILCAYAVYNPKIGYTQGMNIICGKLILLLSIEGNDEQLKQDDVEIIENDEDIFWMFVHVIKQMENLYIKDIPGIHERMSLLRKMLDSRFPELLLHLECNQLVIRNIFQDNISMCFSQYYFTMLMQNQGLKFTRLVFEMFLLFGNAFIQNFILGALQHFSYKILRTNEIEKLMKFFRDEMFVLYHLHLRELRRKNEITAHFIENHYFDDQPFYEEKKQIIHEEVQERPCQNQGIAVQWARLLPTGIFRMAKKITGK